MMETVTVKELLIHEKANKIILKKKRKHTLPKISSVSPPNLSRYLKIVKPP